MLSAITKKIQNLCAGMQSELTGNILPFWMHTMVDEVNGGFHGRIDGTGNLVPGADKGGILNARILWTFSSSYLHLKHIAYLKTAQRARDAIAATFFDEHFGGTYWKITHDGQPLDTKKQIYSQAFFIYAFSEYYRATGDRSALDNALSLFRLIEEKSFDLHKNGYFEAYNREWQLLEDLRLSAKDANEKKTTNTHLHILEAYTNLYGIWPDALLKKQLANLVEIFIDRIIDPASGHLRLFFDEDWQAKSRLISYGHDIEASWLVYEAARAVQDNGLYSRTKPVCIRLAQAALEGYQDDGSLLYETDPVIPHTDQERHWWPQAEAVVGLVNLFEMTGMDQYLDQAVRCWDYIRKNLVDREKGEWYWSILPDGKPNYQEDKAGFWKCPYHNSRACLEIMKRCR